MRTAGRRGYHRATARRRGERWITSYDQEQRRKRGAEDQRRIEERRDERVGERIWTKHDVPEYARKTDSNSRYHFYRQRGYSDSDAWREIAYEESTSRRGGGRPGGYRSPYEARDAIRQSSEMRRMDTVEQAGYRDAKNGRAPARYPTHSRENFHYRRGYEVGLREHPRHEERRFGGNRPDSHPQAREWPRVSDDQPRSARDQERINDRERERAWEREKGRQNEERRFGGNRPDGGD